MELTFNKLKDCMNSVVIFFMAVPVFIGQIISLMMNPDRKDERDHLINKYSPYVVAFLGLFLLLLITVRMASDKKRR